MTVFSKIKAVRDLRAQAKEMQSVLQDVHVETEHKGTKITLSGNLEVEQLTLNRERSINDLQNDLKDLLNDALKKTQRKMAEKMKESGKMNFPGLT